MQKWEYSEIRIDWKSQGLTRVWVFQYKDNKYQENELISVMNMMGKEGWEFVGIAEGKIGGGVIDKYFRSYLLLFKRPIE